MMRKNLRKWKDDWMTRIVFMGTPDFSVPVLGTLIDDGYEVVGVVTQPDRPKGRKKVMTPPPVKEEALRRGIPVLQPEKVREEAETDKILALEPDLIVTAAFDRSCRKSSSIIRNTAVSMSMPLFCRSCAEEPRSITPFWKAKRKQA